MHQGRREGPITRSLDLASESEFNFVFERHVVTMTLIALGVKHHVPVKFAISHPDYILQLRNFAKLKLVHYDPQPQFGASRDVEECVRNDQ